MRVSVTQLRVARILRVELMNVILFYDVPRSRFYDVIIVIDFLQFEIRRVINVLVYRLLDLRMRRSKWVLSNRALSFVSINSHSFNHSWLSSRIFLLSVLLGDDSRIISGFLESCRRALLLQIDLVDVIK